MLAFASCNFGGGSGDTGNTPNAPNTPNEPSDTTVDGVLYAPGTALDILFVDETLSGFANELFYSVGANVTGAANIKNTDAGAEADHELIIGRTERQVSKKAYERLERLEKPSDHQSAYLIYSDGNSVAIAFENDEFDKNAALAVAIEELSKTAGTSDTFELKVGDIAKGFVDPVEYQQAVDEEIVASAWKTLELTLYSRLDKPNATFRDEKGEEVDLDGYVAALMKQFRSLYSLYTDGAVDWFANLYDPAIGGYYFSNSARNTIGYLPDIESTNQAINFIVGSGMADNYSEAIPEWMQKQVVAFVKKLQDPNGYFYHPQWGKELLDNHPSRRNRDLEWAGGILSRYNAKPTYDTPSGMKGDGILWNGEPVAKAENELTAKLSLSVSSAVSKVVPVDSTAAIPDILKTKEAFLKYLGGLDIRNNCYGAGNELATYASQFKARDAQLEKEGADWRCIDLVIGYLNDNVYPETGHWSSVANYNGTNGLLKISALYNSLGEALPYPLEAAKSAIASIATDERAQTICYVYNAWYSIGNIKSNLINYSGLSNGKELADEIANDLLANCAEGLLASVEKTATFKREDGSFSYLVTGSSTNSQGMPVAVPQSLEGDVNATEIGIVGTANWIFSALGLSSVQVPIFTESDHMRYMRTLSELEAVIKNPEDTEVDILHFDDDDIGYDPSYIELEFKSSGSAKVEEKPDGKDGDNVVRFSSKNNGGDLLTFACDSLRLGASCFVFEFDMLTESATNGNFLQVSLGNRCTMIMFSNDSAGIHLSDISSGSTPRLMNDYGVTVGFNEWHHYKIEYYIGNEESVRVVTTVDDKIVAVTDNYYDSTAARLKGKVGNPVTSYTEASILALSYVNCEVLLDNVSCYKTNSIYQAITDPDNQPNINIDAPVGEIVSAPGEGKYFNDPAYAEYANKYTYDFMGYPAPSFTGPAWGKMYSQNGMLNFERVAPSGSGETYIQYILAAPKNLDNYNNYCTIYEFDYRVSEDDLSYDNAPFRLDDSNYIRFVKNSDGKTWSLGTADTAEIKCGEWANIRFEIYYVNEYTEIAKVFVDGEFATEVRLGTMSPFNGRMCIYMKKGISLGTVINVDNMIIIHLDKAYVEEGAPEGGEDEEEDGVNTDIGEAAGNGVYYKSDATANVTRWDFSTETTPSLSGTNSLTYVKDYKHLLFLKSAEGSEGYLNFSKGAPSSFTDMAYTVIEFDFYANKITDGGYGLGFRFDDNNWVYFAKNDDGESWSLGNKNTATIKENTWHNIRFEIYYRSVVSADVYVDGVKTTTVNVADANPFTARLLVYMKSAVPVDTLVGIDNLFFGHFTKESDEVVNVEKVEAPESNGKFYNSAVSYNGSSKKLNFDTLENTAALNSNAASVISVNGVGKYQLTDSTAETFVRIENQAAPSITEFITVAEFDMLFSGYDFDNMAEYPYYFMPIRIYDASGNNEYIRFVKNSDGTLSLEKAEAVKIEADKWFNVRLEFVYGESGIELDIYVDGTYVTTKTLTKATATVTKTWITLNKRIYNTAEDAEQGAVYFDNLFFGHIDAQPTKERVPAGGDTTEPGEGEEEEKPVAPSFELGKGIYYNSTDTAKAYRQWNFNTTGTLNGFSGEAFATGTYVDGVAVLERTASDWSTAHFYYNVAEREFVGDPTGATCKVFEFDYKMSHMFSGTNDARSLFRLDGGDYIKAYRNSDGATLSLGAKDTAAITPDEWCNIRFEFYNVSGAKYVQIYVNNTYAYTQTLTDTANTYNNRIYFYLEAATSVGTTVSVDNLVMAYVVKDYVENPSVDTEPEEKPEEPTEPTFTLGSGVYYNDNTATNAKRYDYSSSMISVSGQMTRSLVDGVFKAVKNTDPATGNAYASEATVYGADNGIADSVYASMTNPALIFETDIKFEGFANSKIDNVMVRFNGLGKQNRFYLTTDGEKVTLAGTDMSLNIGEWYNLRFEFYKISDDGANGTYAAKVYVNNEYVGTKTPTTEAKADPSFRFRLYMTSYATAVGSTFYLDNTFYGYVDKEYVAGK